MGKTQASTLPPRRDAANTKVPASDWFLPLSFKGFHNTLATAPQFLDRLLHCPGDLRVFHALVRARSFASTCGLSCSHKLSRSIRRSGSESSDLGLRGRSDGIGWHPSCILSFHGDTAHETFIARCMANWIHTSDAPPRIFTAGGASLCRAIIKRMFNELTPI